VLPPPVEYGLMRRFSQSFANERFPLAAEVQNNPTWLPVVAAAIFNEDGHFLMYRRPEGKHHGGLWEFPGGKVEADETPAFALVREIREELGLALKVEALEPVAFADGTGEGGHPPIVILLYKAMGWSGEPFAHEGGAWGWFTPEEAGRLPKPPLDVLLLASLHKVSKSAG